MRAKSQLLATTGFTFEDSAIVFASYGLRVVRAAGIDNDDFLHLGNSPRTLERLGQFARLVERGDDDREGHGLSQSGFFWLWEIAEQHVFHKNVFVQFLPPKGVAIKL